jgi:hypothetical protein
MELTKVARGIEPAEYILSILPPQDRLEVIFKIENNFRRLIFKRKVNKLRTSPKLLTE